MEEQIIRDFKEKVRIEATIRKFIKKDLIYKLISIFSIECSEQEYQKKINNPLDLVLSFYKEYNEQYYNMIMAGIEEKRIVFSGEKGKSYVDTNDGKSYIRTYGNDGDIFIIAHELAHYVDRNSKHKIIPNSFWYFAETFAIYMEKRLEQWLSNESYRELIETRRNNRIYFESKMLKTIGNELYYESSYIENGEILNSDIDMDEVRDIMHYGLDDIVNSLLSYPMANVLSDFLKSRTIRRDKDILDTCLGLDLYKYFENYEVKNKVVR